jgi:hypothetical protein
MSSLPHSTFECVNNPFTFAEIELDKLKNLANLQTSKQQLIEKINLSINKLSEKIILAILFR